MPARVVMTLRARCAVLLMLVLGAACTTVPIGGPTAPRDDPNAGVLTLSSGRAVAIYPADLRFTGTAEYRWPDGRTYDGEWLNGEPQGRGTETLPDGETYAGQWDGGMRHGLGELLGARGGLYQGEFHRGVREGNGVQFSEDGVYQGEWSADREHGYGELAGAHGSRYTGQWREGLRAGQGAYQGADGSSYEGEWLDDHPHGFGIYRFPHGAVYSGGWQAGLQHGAGRLVEISGVTYEGNWEAGYRQGFGIERRPDGGEYAGEWQAGKRSGQGRETRPDGTIHEGLWELDRPLGPGLRRYPSGIEIRGAWTDDNVTSGLLSLPGGLEYAGPLFSRANARVSPILLRWLEDAAVHGNGLAQLLAATAYLDYTDPAPDPERARQWLTSAADAGIAEAAFRLGVLLLEQADAAATTHSAALRWLRQAADTGHAEANRLLGDLYAGAASGTAIPDSGIDGRKAAEYYRAALRAGSPLAAERLARLLVTTTDTQLRDPTEALAVIEWVALHTRYWLAFDTLAVASAANGDASAAAHAQARAIDAARPVPGATLAHPEPSRGTPARPVSPLIAPPPPEPELEAMRARLEQFQALQNEAGQSPAES